jgi:hypothetical protein
VFSPGAATAEDAERREFLEHLDSAPFQIGRGDGIWLERLLMTNDRVFTACERSVIDDLRNQYAARF